MLDSVAIERYEQHLLGNKNFVLNGSREEKERASKVIIRYAVTQLLGWDAKETEEHMTWHIIKCMHLDVLFKYIHFPSDIDPETDTDYIACIAYPNYQYNVRRQIERVYGRILDGTIERFPKKIFDGARGKEKGAVLLNDFIAKNLVVRSTEDLYEQFADSAKMNNKFRDAYIYAAARKLYPTTLDYLHNSLPDDERDDFLYAYWQYINVSKMAEEAARKEEKEALAVPSGKT